MSYYATLHHPDGTHTEVTFAWALVLQKAKHGPVPEGARFVTLHPHGPGQHGVVVLIVPSGTQKGAWTVHGGAGGKLNGLTLTGVRTRAEYDHDQREKRLKEKDARNKETPEQATAHRAIDTAATDAKDTINQDYIGKVAPALGMDKWRFDDQNDVKALEEKHGKAAVGLLRYRHHQALISQLGKLTHEARAAVATDDVLRAAVLDATANDNPLGLPALLPEGAKGGVGYATDRKERHAAQRAAELTPAMLGHLAAQSEQLLARQHGAVEALCGPDSPAMAFFDLSAARRRDWLTQAQGAALQGDHATATDFLARIEKEERAWASRLSAKNPAATMEAAARFGDMLEQMHAGAKAAQDSGAVSRPRLGDLGDQAETVQKLLLASHERVAKLRQVRDTENKLDPADHHLLEDGYLQDAFKASETIPPDALTDTLRQQIMGDHATEIGHSLLSATEDPGTALHGIAVTGPELRQAMREHIGAGAFGSLNLSALAALGQSGLDRDTVTVLGVKGSAQVLAAHLKKKLKKADVEHLTRALEDYQQGPGIQEAKEALADGERILGEARGIDLDHDGAADDFLHATLLSRLKQQAIRDGMQRIGTEAGAMMARAELIWALRQSPRIPAIDGDPAPAGAIAATVVTGKDITGVIHAARALGLDQDDYDIRHTREGQHLVLLASAAPKLVRSDVPADEAVAREEVSAIVKGQRDEANWLPGGFSRRTRTTLETPGGVEAGQAPQLRSRPLALAVKHHLAALLADGKRLPDALAEMHDPDFIRAHVDDTDGYVAALDRLMPDDWSPQKRQAAVRRLIDETRPPGAGTVAERLHQASQAQAGILDTDDPNVYEAIQRTLAELPAGALAFRAPGELTRQDQRVLRGWYLKERDPVDHESSWKALVAEHGVNAPLIAQRLLRGKVAAAWSDHYHRAGGLRFSAEQGPEGMTLPPQVAGALGSVWPNVATNFNATGKVTLYADLRMDGSKVKQQRAIKMLQARRKAYWALGTGSGKTITSLGAFAHLHSEGAVKRGLFVVPSVVQGQFHAEALRVLDPGMRRADGGRGFRWWAKRGADATARRAAYADPQHDFVVVTHQALRDDANWAVAQHLGMAPEAVTDHLRGMTRPERASTVQAAFKRQGWHTLTGPDAMTVVDEAHYLSNRAGKENAGMANVIDALGDLNGHHVLMSGTPVKNDPSEIFDMLSKLDPAQYHDRDLFLRRYGSSVHGAALQREIAPYVYAERIPSGRKAQRIRGNQGQALALTPKQQAAYAGVLRDVQAVKGAARKGVVEVEAMKRITPGSFTGPESGHEAVAKNLQDDVAGLREWALARVVNSFPWQENAKIQHLRELAGDMRAQGKPGVVFAHHLETVAQVRDALEADGHRVVHLVGSDSGAEKDRKRLQFAPDGGATPEADIFILSDAGATGLNLQRGKWLAHVDVPLTSVVHEQRSARIDRMGQTEDVEIHDLVSDTPYDLTAERRLRKKADLGRIVQSPNGALDDIGLAGLYQKQREGLALKANDE